MLYESDGLYIKLFGATPTGICFLLNESKKIYKLIQPFLFYDYYIKKIIKFNKSLTFHPTRHIAILKDK